MLTPQQRFDLITRNLEEVIGADELMMLLENNKPINHYVGFEISGKPHIGQAVIVMQKVKDLVDAGVNVNFFLADWHTYINGKLDGNLKYIEEVGNGYFKEIIKAAFIMLGGDVSKLNFIKASEFYTTHPTFWLTMLEVAKNTTLSRMERSVAIMGRKESDVKDFATLIYPAMQAADIFSMNINLAQGGIDQRKVHVIMRDTAKFIKTNAPETIDGKLIKPVAIHTQLLPALSAPSVWPLPEGIDLKQMQQDMKMSKSDPNNAMFIDDDVEKIRKIIMKGFCSEKDISYNPILQWINMIVFQRDNKSITIQRPEQHGGNISFENYEDLKEKFVAGLVHPIDVKNFLADYLINLFKPAREYFEVEPYKSMKIRCEEILSLIIKRK